ncbi:FAD binding domain-containing protein [Mycobacterium paraense]|uniref:FAD binding domain-containing protein n=1 Tax=Mycobacterium paraense TaxID=767916 RepID=UPI000A15AAC9|nr:FAD binding domain-containing protein [Mycobacterium paraense]ORW44968.1 hypothetical protein AWB88_04710 [Mycobacterium paraense]
MKPAPFEMLRAANLDEALGMLADDPEDGKVLAGGQSLIPMMNFRLARPARLIDINQVTALDGIDVTDSCVTIKSTTRHRAVECSDVAGPLGHLLRQAASKVGHLPIRTRGTFGGSIAHCDSASEWCVVARLLDADMTIQSYARGTRKVAAADFFQSTFVTALRPDEILTHTTLPVLDDTYRTGIAEYARRAGDFGIVLTAVAIQIIDGVVTDAKICIGGAAPIPLRSSAAEQACLGQQWCTTVAAQVADIAAADINPSTDAHADATYRRALVRALLPRSVPPSARGAMA